MFLDSKTFSTYVKESETNLWVIRYEVVEVWAARDTCCTNVLKTYVHYTSKNKHTKQKKVNTYTHINGVHKLLD